MENNKTDILALTEALKQIRDLIDTTGKTSLFEGLTNDEIIKFFIELNSLVQTFSKQETQTGINNQIGRIIIELQKNPEASEFFKITYEKRVSVLHPHIAVKALEDMGKENPDLSSPEKVLELIKDLTPEQLKQTTIQVIDMPNIQLK